MKLIIRKKVVQLPYLGKVGRFGNQLFQYAFGKKYASLVNASLEIPENWIGRKIFFIDDPPITSVCRKYASPIYFTPLFNKVNIAFAGVAHKQACINILNRRELKEVFKFRPEWSLRYPKKKQHYVAAHLRRGDYLASGYCVVSKDSYCRAMESSGYNVDDVVWVTEENPEVDILAKECGCGFLSDFFTLMQADVIFRGNSTFSWWAATLGNGEIYSPVVECLAGEHTVPFVRGNHPKWSCHRGDGEDLFLPE
jgi:hypothetical protein